MPQRRPPLICQVSSLADLPVAQYYQVEAICLGVSAFQLGHAIEDFTWPQLLTALDYCQSHGIESFLDLTFYPQQSIDVESLSEHLQQLSPQPNAVIIHDPGLLRVMRELFIDTAVFLGPLQCVYTPETALFWANQGICGAFLPWDFPLEQLDLMQQKLPAFKWILSIAGYPLQGFVSGSLQRTVHSHCGNSESGSTGLAQHQTHWNQHGLLLYPQNKISSSSTWPYLYEHGIAYGYLGSPLEVNQEQWKWVYQYKQWLAPLGGAPDEYKPLDATQVVGMIRERGSDGIICELYGALSGSDEVVVLTQNKSQILQLPAYLDKFDGERLTQAQPRDFICLPFPDLPVHALVLKPTASGTSNCTSAGSAIEPV